MVHRHHARRALGCLIISASLSDLDPQLRRYDTAQTQRNARQPAAKLIRILAVGTVDQIGPGVIETLRQSLRHIAGEVYRAKRSAIALHSGWRRCGGRPGRR